MRVSLKILTARNGLYGSSWDRYPTRPLIMFNLDDKKFFKEKGDPGFNPNRNKAVIAKTIEETNKMRMRKHKKYVDEVRMRADAVASFLKYKDRGGEKTVENYLGEKILREMQSQKRIQALKVKYADNKKIVTANLGDISL